MSAISAFSEKTFKSLCDQLAAEDHDLRSIIEEYGYPPVWSRPNSFESMVWFILEQQVSLASAKAALETLRKRLGTVTPKNILALSDEDLRACHVSRQKTGYIQGVARAIKNQELSLTALETKPDGDIRSELIKLKGIGSWTVDAYLIFVLHRSDVFPVGDLAIVKALRLLKNLPQYTSTEEMLAIAEDWRPHRTMASMLLWHYYLSSRAKKH